MEKVMPKKMIPNMVAGLAALFISLFPALSPGLCLKDCQKITAGPAGSPEPSSIGYMADSVRYRERSHNTGDVKNSVMGDVNIRVGHERVDIRLDSGTSDNLVDASISSTIILGDMKR